MHLTHRESAHNALGHWHFKRNSDLIDCKFLERNLSSVTCDHLLDVAQQRWDQRISLTAKMYKSTNLENAELQRDKDEMWIPIVKSGFDTDRTWFQIIYLDQTQDLSLISIVESDLGIQIKKDNTHTTTVNGKPWSPLRLAIQPPGAITMCHIDHVTDYEYSGRSRFSESNERKIVVFLQDRTPNQHFVIGNSAVNPWHQGMAVTWDWGTPHHASNFTTSPRINLMIAVDPRDNAHLGYQTWN